MNAVGQAHAVDRRLEGWLEQRERASAGFFPPQAGRIARLCHAMAVRFARGGRLLAAGLTPPARSDVRHVTVEFVHPVIVGKRALPALGLVGDAAPLVAELAALTEPDDIVMAFGGPADGAELADGLAAARARGCLTVAFAPLGAEWELEPPSLDGFVRQELAETTYHILWELVHVFFEHRGLLTGRTEQRRHDAGASSFLYPFLAEREHDLDAVLGDLERSVLMKADDVQGLRAQTLHGSREPLLGAARALRAALEGGGRLLALGNGGSATDAADLVADFLAGGRAALDLTADTAIITALANDIGSESIFARQIIAHGRSGDALVTLSTSGSSLSVLAALTEARRRDMETVAFVGYDGGRVVAEALADHVILSPSQYIPRIQEAQATAYHLLRDLVEAPV